MTVVHCKKEPYDVYIGRPGKWGNPFSDKYYGRAKCIEMYADWLDGKIYIGQTPPSKSEIISELKGKVLGCWCKPKACHGDILSKIANSAKDQIKVVLIIDSCAICHAAKYVTRSWIKKGYKTGIIYGFLSKILILLEKFEPDTIVFAWDTLHNKRKEMYSGYKIRYKVDLTQEEIDENRIAFAQFNQLRDEILCDLGFENVFSQDGYEADDIMAVLVADKKYSSILVTPDHDMFQVLSSTCAIFDSKNNAMITKDKFCNEFNIEPEEWGLVKAIAGCSSDTVDGVIGVGEKTAVKYIRGELGETTKAYAAIEAGLDTIIARNAELVILPLDGIGEFSVSHGISIKIEEFVNMCEKFNFKSFLSTKYLERWKKALRMV